MKKLHCLMLLSAFLSINNFSYSSDKKGGSGPEDMKRHNESAVEQFFEHAEKEICEICKAGCNCMTTCAKVTHNVCDKCLESCVSDKCKREVLKYSICCCTCAWWCYNDPYLKAFNSFVTGKAF